MIKNNYRPDIDGLRSVAVLSVLLFHLGISWFDGGFVGVDVFFVISGFLITRLIKSEIDRTGTFDFKNFYIRRIRRLFPALFVTLFVTMVFAVLILSPSHLQRFGGALTSSLASVSNFYFWLEADYFDVSAQVKPLLHTWSLSIEEQFYLVWPLTIFLLYRSKSRGSLFTVLLFTVCLGLGLNIWFSDGSVPLVSQYSETFAAWIADGRATIFFLMPFRIFEFAIGAVLVLVVDYQFKKKLIHDFLFLSGFGLIFYAVIRFNEQMLFPSYFALVPCMGAALLIYSGGNSRFSFMLTNKASVGIGLISYSLYLVHWPVIVFWLYVRGDLTPIDQVGMATFSFLLAYVSYRYVESPFRQMKIDFTRTTMKAASFLAVLLVAALGLHMKQSGGWFWRTSSPVSIEHVGDRGAFHREFYGGAGYLCGGPVKTEMPADIVLIGDSHGRHYAEGLYREWAEPDNKALYIGSDVSCLHLPSFTRIREGFDYDKLCPDGLRLDLSLIKNAASPPLVIVSHSWVAQMKLADMLDESGVRRNVNVGVEDVIIGIKRLRGRIGNSPLVVIGHVPTSGQHNLYDIFSRPKFPFSSLFYSEDYLKTQANEEYVQFNQRLSQEAQSSGEFVFLDPHDVLCEEGLCRNTDHQNRLIYSDPSHLSKYGSREVIRAFLPQLKKALRGNHETTMNSGYGLSQTDEN